MIIDLPSFILEKSQLRVQL